MGKDVDLCCVGCLICTGLEALGITTSSTKKVSTTVLDVERLSTNPQPNSTPAAVGLLSSKVYREQLTVPLVSQPNFSVFV